VNFVVEMLRQFVDSYSPGQTRCSDSSFYQVSHKCALAHALLLTKGYRQGCASIMLPILWLFFQYTTYTAGLATLTLFFR